MRMIPKFTSAVIIAAFSATALIGANVAAQTGTTPPPRSNRATMQPPRPNRAAQPPRDKMRRSAQRKDGMGRGPAANMLRMRKQLNLTNDQVTQLEGLSAKSATQMNRAEMMRARADLVEARKGDINVDKARAAYDHMARLRTDQHVAQLKSQQDVRTVLTTDQRSKVDAMAKRMRHRRGANAMRGRDGARAGRTGGAPRGHRPPADDANKR